MDAHEYSIGQIARMSGVSLRTLRFYDECGLLVPHRAENGYRVYTDALVDRLQQILLYRELDIPIEDIARLLECNTDRSTILSRQRDALERKRARIDTILALIDATIESQRGGTNMTAEQKLDAFVQRKLDDNDAAYGSEMREKFGEEAYEKRYDAVKGMNKNDFEHLEAGLEEIHSRMATCMRDGYTPESDEAQQLVSEHHTYLGNFGDFYTDEVYYQIGQGYAQDPRFRAHYEDIAPGLADWIARAIAVHCG